MDLEVSAVMLLTLVLSPISWTHHYLIITIPLYTVVAAAIRHSRPGPWLAAFTGVAFLLIARKPHHDLFAAGYSRLALSAALYGALILWGACLTLHFRGVDGPKREDGVVAHAG